MRTSENSPTRTLVNKGKGRGDAARRLCDNVQAEGPALVAEPSQRLIPLELSGGDACGNADGVAGGARRGACGACGNVSVVFLLQLPTGSSLHPLSQRAGTRQPRRVI
jgi:hypothetical protein